MTWFLIALELIVLHTVDGRAIRINPAQFTTVVEPRADPVHTEKARCTVNFTDGKFITVRETCDVVKALLEENRK